MFNAAMFAFGHVAAACIAKAIALYRGSTLATGDMVQDHLRSTLTPADDNAIRLIGRACMTMRRRGRGFGAGSRHASAHAPSPVLLGAAWRRLADTDG